MPNKWLSKRREAEQINSWFGPVTQGGLYTLSLGVTLFIFSKESLTSSLPKHQRSKGYVVKTFLTLEDAEKFQRDLFSSYLWELRKEISYFYQVDKKDLPGDEKWNTPRPHFVDKWLDQESISIDHQYLRWYFRVGKLTNEYWKILKPAGYSKP